MSVNATRAFRARKLGWHKMALLWAVAFGLGWAVALTQPAAAADPTSPTASAGAEGENAATAADIARTYHLGPGDKVRVIVFQEPDLSGEFEVDSTGRVSLPLVDPINAQDLTIRQFQDAVTAKLKSGFLVNPRVSVEIINYRPFYITGEVNKPGEYPYVAGMNILKAVAMAGGYTYRANTSRVVLSRHDTGKEENIDPNTNTMVLPGDMIRVKERFF